MPADHAHFNGSVNLSDAESVMPIPAAAMALPGRSNIALGLAMSWNNPKASSLLGAM